MDTTDTAAGATPRSNCTWSSTTVYTTPANKSTCSSGREWTSHALRPSTRITAHAHQGTHRSCHSKIWPEICCQEILEANNVSYDQLPMIQKCTGHSGRLFLCWNHVLKGCTYHACSFRNMGGHPDLKDYPSSFAASVCLVLQPGVDHLMSQETSANESQKRKADKLAPQAPAK